MQKSDYVTRIISGFHFIPKVEPKQLFSDWWLGGAGEGCVSEGLGKIPKERQFVFYLDYFSLSIYHDY